MSGISHVETMKGNGSVRLRETPRRFQSLRVIAHLLSFIAGMSAMYVIQSLSPRPLAAPAKVDVIKPDGTKPVETADSRVTDERKPEEEVSEPTERDDECVFPGLTEPAPGRYAKLPLATQHPIAFVDVKPGDRIKKGWQVFSHWESPETLQAAQSEVARTKSLLDAAELRCEQAKRSLEQRRKAASVVAKQELRDLEAAVELREAEVVTARTSLERVEKLFTAAEFEFTQAFVTSPIDGVVESVEVVQGERRQAGGTFRGVTILDPRLLYCRCELSLEELAALEKLGMADHNRLAECLTVSVRQSDHRLKAAITFVGVSANPKTGRIPVLVEIENPDELLRSGVRVDVHFERAKSR